MYVHSVIMIGTDIKIFVILVSFVFYFYLGCDKHSSPTKYKISGRVKLLQAGRKVCPKSGTKIFWKFSSINLFAENLLP